MNSEKIEINLSCVDIATFKKLEKLIKEKLPGVIYNNIADYQTSPNQSKLLQENTIKSMIAASKNRALSYQRSLQMKKINEQRKIQDGTADELEQEAEKADLETLNDNEDDSDDQDEDETNGDESLSLSEILLDDYTPLFKYPPFADKLTCVIINNMLYNLNFPNSKSRRYYAETLQFAFMLYCQQPSEYLLARQKLMLPSKATLFRVFGKDIAAWKELLLSKSSSLPVFLRFRELYPYTDEELREQCHFCIGIDAITGKLWKKSGHDDQIEDLFALYLMPLDCKGPSICLHIIQHTNGLASGIMSEILDYIATVQKTLNVPVFTTDGDKSYDFVYQIFFHHWYSLVTGFDGLVEVLKSAKFQDLKIIFIADVVHIGKNLRTLLIFPNKLIFLQPYDPTLHVDITKIRLFSKLGDAINNCDKSTTLNDKYPVTIFNVQTVKDMLDNNCYTEATWLLPLALWFEGVRNTILPVEARLSMFKLAFFILHFFLRLQDVVGVTDRLPNIETPDHRLKFKGYLFARRMHLLKMATSLLTLYGFLEEFPNINFQHLTTLPVEHLFALFRKFAHSKKEVKDLMSAGAHLVMNQTYREQNFDRLVSECRLDNSGANMANVEEMP